MPPSIEQQGSYCEHCGTVGKQGESGAEERSGTDNNTLFREGGTE